MKRVLLVREVDGEPMVSTDGLSLLMGVPVSEDDSAESAFQYWAARDMGADVVTDEQAREVWLVLP